MKNLTYFIAFVLTSLSLQAQIPHANVGLDIASVTLENASSIFTDLEPLNSHPNEITFTISGIYTQSKIETIKTNIRSLLNESTDLTTLSTLSINIESSGKIAVIPQGKLDEKMIDNIREYLSTYDWDYLHEIMTVDILIVFNRPH